MKFNPRTYALCGMTSSLLVILWIVSCSIPQSFRSQPTYEVDLSTISPVLPVEIVDHKGIPMKLVPAGDSTIGSDQDKDTNNPSHRLYLDSFYMDQYEVTNVRYRECVTASICDFPVFARSDFRPGYFGNPEYDNFPVMYVTWTMARTYCEDWRSARLPTEAEWEKAARGTDGRTYPWGESISCDQANYDGDPDPFTFCVGDTSEVGSYTSGPSLYGLYDMAGNLFEWTSSLYKPYPYDATDGREDLTRSGDRVIRGGAWSESAENQTVFYRSWIGPQLSESAIGFRCARDVASSLLLPPS